MHVWGFRQWLKEQAQQAHDIAPEAALQKNNPLLKNP
jgi:acyl-CoA hydrolase